MSSRPAVAGTWRHSAESGNPLFHWPGGLCARHKRQACAAFLLALLPLSGVGADPPASVTYTYDDAGRLRTGTFSDSKVVQYQYDPTGNRTSVTMGVPAQLSIANAAAAEGTTQDNALTFVVTKTGTSLQDVTVSCVSIDGTAQTTQPGQPPYDDYTPINQQITFLASSPSGATQNCTVWTKRDAYYEANETFSVTLQNVSAGAVITNGTATGTITNDDAAPSFSVASVSQPEGSALTFTISKSGLTQLTHGISYATENGTATTADADYTAVALTSTTFAPTQTSFQVNVSTTHDSKYEANETFGFRLSAATGGASISGTNPATGTITNNDPAPTFGINSPAAVQEGGQITFTVTKSGSTGLAHSLSWATANNTAVAPGDYQSGSGTVDFQPSDTTKTIVIQTNTDAVSGEGDETFYVDLTTNGSSNGAVITTSQGVGTISDPSSSVPGVPGNLRTNPDGINYGNNYDVLWNASTGAPSYYVLEESAYSGFSPLIATHTVNAPTTFKYIWNGGYGDRYYRVRACNASNQCSAWSWTVVITNCPTGECF